MKNILIPDGYKQISRRHKPKSGDMWSDYPTKDVSYFVPALAAIQNKNWKEYRNNLIIIRPIN